MKIIKNIKQISTGLIFEISYCNFYNDVVHFHNTDYGDKAFIPNNDWEFVEEKPFELSYSEIQSLEKENSQKRSEVVKKAHKLFPDISQISERLDYIKNEYNRLNIHTFFN